LNLLDNIRSEQNQLENLRKSSDRIVNTSNYNVHKLKSHIIDIARKNGEKRQMTINTMSFGYKYGIPHEADLIMDVRFLANPYFIPELKDLDGETEEVKTFILEKDTTRVFLQKYLELLEYLIPFYEKEGKSYLTIAIGCTGGKHRSVAIAAEIHKYLGGKRKIGIVHRDKER